jgi:hypothetical protein
MEVTTKIAISFAILFIVISLIYSIFCNKPKTSDYYIVIMQKFGNVKEYRELSTRFTSYQSAKKYAESVSEGELDYTIEKINE